MAESFDGQLHDQSLTNIAQGMWPDIKDVEWVNVPEDRKIELNEQAQEMYLACAFISQADPKRYGRLKEELENDYTKGTDSYPQDMVKRTSCLMNISTGRQEPIHPNLLESHSSRRLPKKSSKRRVGKESDLPHVWKEGSHMT